MLTNSDRRGTRHIVLAAVAVLASTGCAVLAAAAPASAASAAQSDSQPCSATYAPVVSVSGIECRAASLKYHSWLLDAGIGDWWVSREDDRGDVTFQQVQRDGSGPNLPSFVVHHGSKACESAHDPIQRVVRISCDEALRI